MENLEALVLDSLVTESVDILSDEFKITLVNVHGVSEIILLYVLLRIADELANGLDAG